MIYISETDTKITLPRHYSGNDITSLKVKNNMTGAEQTFLLAGDVSTNSFYYEFNISLELQAGEYTYTLGAETGLLTFGDFTPSRTHYQSTNNKIQYDRN